MSCLALHVVPIAFSRYRSSVHRPTNAPSASAAAANSEERGAHQLKGVPGEWRLFAVASP